VVVVEVSRTPFIQTGRTIKITHKAYVLASLLERLQVLAVAVLNAIIKKVDHLLNVGEMPGESGVLDVLVT
jgi:hypothetical protein